MAFLIIALMPRQQVKQKLIHEGQRFRASHIHQSSVEFIHGFKKVVVPVPWEEGLSGFEPSGKPVTCG